MTQLTTWAQAVVVLSRDVNRTARNTSVAESTRNVV